MATTDWLVRREKRPDALLRMYCFPHSGGSPGEYLRWGDFLPGIEVWGIQLPGRGARLHEDPFLDMADAVSSIVREVHFEKPFIFFGHSLGAVMAFEVARQLAARSEGPARLIVSASPAPHTRRPSGSLSELSDQELVEYIGNRYGGFPAEFAEYPELLEMILPAHRGDFSIVESYKYEEGPLLTYPLTVIGATEDEISTAELVAWGDLSATGAEILTVPGGHFYFRSDPESFLKSLNSVLIEGEETK